VPLVQLSEVSLAYGHVALLDHADLVIEPGERIGLIGRNGTGKSSLLRIVAGESKADGGKVFVQPGARLASVPQEPAFEPGHGLARHPALGVLRDRLVPGATVVLDDVERPGEQEVVRRWEDEFGLTFRRVADAGVAIATVA